MATEHLRRGEVQQRLGEAGWFAGLSPRLAEAVLDAGRQVSFSRGASMFEPQGDPGGIYGVISGGIVISLPGRHGVPAAGHIMRRGEWFGYGAVLFRKSRTLLAEANEPSVLLHVPLAQADAIRAGIPGADLAFTLLAAFGETAILMFSPT
jgi:CRP/FNR family transcriptional regulator, cyclic AMP receptor protein